MRAGGAGTLDPSTAGRPPAHRGAGRSNADDLAVGGAGELEFRAPRENVRPKVCQQQAAGAQLAPAGGNHSVRQMIRDRLLERRRFAEEEIRVRRRRDQTRTPRRIP